jgi:hypothetical protein
MFPLNHILFKRLVCGVPGPSLTLGTGNADPGSGPFAPEMQVDSTCRATFVIPRRNSRDVFAGAATGAGPLICAVVGSGMSNWPPQWRKNSFLRPSPRLAA